MNAFSIFFILLATLFPLSLQAPDQQSSKFKFSSTAEYEFGQEMRFLLEVSNLGIASGVTLFVLPENATTPLVLEAPFAIGAPFRSRQKIDLSELNLPPFSTIEYWWIVETEDGEVASPKETVVYADNAFMWQEMTQNGVTARWSGQGPFFGQEVLDLVAETSAQLAPNLPLEGVTPYAVVVYPSAADMGGMIGTELSTSFDWDVVFATAENSTSNESNLANSVPYGVTQMLLYQAAGSRYSNLPFWLVEGLALSQQKQPDPANTDVLLTAIRAHETLPFSELCTTWPFTEDPDYQLARAQSPDFIRYLQEKYGPQAVAELVAAYTGGADCEVGVTAVLNTSLAEVEKAWLENRQPPSLLTQVTQKYALWGLLLLAGFGITGLIIWLTVRGRPQSDSEY